MKTGYLEKHEKFLADFLASVQGQKSLVTLSEAWAKEDALLWVEQMLWLVTHLIYSTVTTQAPAFAAILRVYRQPSVSKLFHYYDVLLEMRQKIRSPIAFQTQLMIESLWMEFIYDC